jgi:hypothetical protein
MSHIWNSLPTLRVIDAAYLLAGMEPPGGLKGIRRAPALVNNLLDLIEARTGAVKLATMPGERATITQSEFESLLTEFGAQAAATLMTAPQSLDEINAVSLTSTNTPPIEPAPTDDAGLSRREKQIRAIEAEARKLGYDLLNIQTGGKAELRKACKTSRPELFGAGDDPFNDAWSDAVRSSPPRLRMANHHKFAAR